jgi:hypothetical protein
MCWDGHVEEYIKQDGDWIPVRVEELVPIWDIALSDDDVDKLAEGADFRTIQPDHLVTWTAEDLGLPEEPPFARLTMAERERIIMRAFSEHVETWDL